MGINLPAHLVIIKNTTLYVDGTAQEYTSRQMLQMIGRAGRPQVYNPFKLNKNCVFCFALVRYLSDCRDNDNC